ncbi:hypothetical protein, partial [Duncaniella freteri]|uniref:hypothetical protein n=2 Tax=Duncaniella TaxID=2518495 RepID=UPI00258ED8EA
CYRTVFSPKTQSKKHISKLKKISSFPMRLPQQSPASHLSTKNKHQTTITAETHYYLQILGILSNFEE